MKPTEGWAGQILQLVKVASKDQQGSKLQTGGNEAEGSTLNIKQRGGNVC